MVVELRLFHLNTSLLNQSFLLLFHLNTSLIKSLPRILQLLDLLVVPESVYALNPLNRLSFHDRVLMGALVEPTCILPPLLLSRLGSLTGLLGCGLSATGAQLRGYFLAQSLLFEEPLMDWLVGPLAGREDSRHLVNLRLCPQLWVLQMDVQFLLRQVYQSLIQVHLIQILLKLSGGNGPTVHAVSWILTVVREVVAVIGEFVVQKI